MLLKNTCYTELVKSVAVPPQVKCSVQNGSSLIDLTPLIHMSGYYRATGQ